MLATVQKQKKKKKKNNPEGLKVFVCKYNKERKTTTTPKTATKKKTKTKKRRTICILVPCDPEGSRKLCLQYEEHPPMALHTASIALYRDHHPSNLPQNKNKTEPSEKRTNKKTSSMPLHGL